MTGNTLEHSGVPEDDAVGVGNALTNTCGTHKRKLFSSGIRFSMLTYVCRPFVLAMDSVYCVCHAYVWMTLPLLEHSVHFKNFANVSCPSCLNPLYFTQLQ